MIFEEAIEKIMKVRDEILDSFTKMENIEDFDKYSLGLLFRLCGEFYEYGKSEKQSQSSTPSVQPRDGDSGTKPVRMED